MKKKLYKNKTLKKSQLIYITKMFKAIEVNSLNLFYMNLPQSLIKFSHGGR